MKWAILLNLSTMVRMTEFHLEQGSPVIKSTKMWDHGRPATGRGWKRPTGAWWEDLCWLQETQACM